MRGRLSGPWWRGWALAVAAICCGLVWRVYPAAYQSDPTRTKTRIPPSYFGLTINKIGQRTPWPEVAFSGIRLWGAVYWAELNPAPGVFDWTRFDAILDQAQQRGVDVVFNLAFTPHWAASAPDAPPTFSPGASSPPAQIGQWEQFIQAALERAAGRIRYWEIWNEPEDPKYYSGSVATMVTLQKRAFEIIKQTDPSLQVISPPSIGTPDGFRWQAAFFAAGGGQYADIIGFHGYWDDPKPEAALPVIAQFKKLVAEYGLSGKPMWDTEAGWPATLKDTQARAAFVARSYLLRWSFGIDRFYWYAYEGGGAEFGKLWDPEQGLLLPGIAYRTVEHWLVGSTLLGAIETSNGVWRLKLKLKDGRSALVLWTTASRRAFAAPPNSDHYITLDGGAVPIVNNSVEIGPNPVLLIEKSS